MAGEKVKACRAGAERQRGIINAVDYFNLVRAAAVELAKGQNGRERETYPAGS